MYFIVGINYYCFTLIIVKTLMLIIIYRGHDLQHLPINMSCDKNVTSFPQFSVKNA